MQPDLSTGDEYAASTDDVAHVLRQVFFLRSSLLQPGKQSTSGTCCALSGASKLKGDQLTDEVIF